MFSWHCPFHCAQAGIPRSHHWLGWGGLDYYYYHICSCDTVHFIVLRLGYRGVIIGWDEVALIIVTTISVPVTLSISLCSGWDTAESSLAGTRWPWLFSLYSGWDTAESSLAGTRWPWLLLPYLFSWHCPFHCAQAGIPRSHHWLGRVGLGLTIITVCSCDTVPFILLRLGYRGVSIGWDELALTIITICSCDTVPFILLRLGYRGVIIGWDEVARAPEQWLKLMHKENAYVTTRY